MNSDYHVSKPYDRAIWKGFYIGFTEEEHILLRDGTSEELKKAGFLD